MFLDNRYILVFILLVENKPSKIDNKIISIVIDINSEWIFTFIKIFTLYHWCR